jgi:two-component sensor histidine kinase
MLKALHQNNLRYMALLIAFLISAASIYYSNQLVDKLAEREKQQINLFSKGLKAMADPNTDGSISFLFQEIIEINHSIPVILTDENRNPISERNVQFDGQLSEKEKAIFLKNELDEMAQIHEPILVEPSPGLKNYIYYKNSFLLTQLQYYPYVQLSIIALFGIITFVAYSYSKRAEQNKVWVGLAKETAHQLGTPLSSLMAWVEIFKTDPDFKHLEALEEIEKDVNRLEMVTARFSNIGSKPSMQEHNLYDLVSDSLQYLKNRLSKKVRIHFNTTLPLNETLLVNPPLFAWVIENLCKNAVDAMEGSGDLRIQLAPLGDHKVVIDISDTGKGIPKNKFKHVFRPGFTTKKRGWGLGLTLVKRIVENYHEGKIFVLNSELGRGTTFRLIFNRV